ncbi:MAG: AzlC family protein [Hyphomicrobiales bacterium]|nr:AzlC family protein [Hyphomicrobiales bacterium]
MRERRARTSDSQTSAREFRRGAWDVLPLAAGAGIYGLAFGLLATQAGMGGLDVGVMGGLVFAGAAQIVAVERILAGAGAAVAIIAGLALNLRLLLMTASIRDVFAGRPWWQIALGAHLTTDENWALMLAKRGEGDTVGFAYLVGAGLAILAAWIIATVAGTVSAEAIPDPRALGMDFAFTAAFIAIARSLWRGRHDLAAWSVSALTVAGAIYLLGLEPSWAMILGGLAGAATAGAGLHG